MAINLDNFKWINTKRKCYWPKYQNKKNLSYYLECTYKGLGFVTGAGIFFNLNGKSRPGKLRCLYEDGNVKDKSEACRAVVETFLTVEQFLQKYPCDQKFYRDYEIIQREKPKYTDIPIKLIEKRFSIVFACEYEDPKKIIAEFSSRTQYEVIMCRFQYIRYKGHATLRSVLKKEPIIVTNSESENSDSTFKEQDTMIKSNANGYVVVDLTIDENDIKLKLRNKNAEKTDPIYVTPEKANIHKNDKEWTPIIMLNNLNLDASPEKNTPTKYKLRHRRTKETPERRTSSRLQNKKHDSPKRESDFLYYSPVPKRLSIRRQILTSKIDELVSDNEDENTDVNNIPKKRQIDDSDNEKPKKISNLNDTTKSPRVRVSNLTPTIQKREVKLNDDTKPFEKAKTQLNVNVQNGSLPCREQEYEDILNFVRRKLKDQAGGCMYISGVPGTGKTATVFQVMETLASLTDKKKVPGFEFIKVNALALTEPRQIYVQIVKQMQDKLLHWEAALNFIVDFFTKKKKSSSYVLLVDELDKLCTRKQDVVYNLLDLPSRCKTPLIVITIANTMDLPERLLANKINSRLGLTRLTFKPYKYKQIIEIVRARLLSVENTFRTEAIEFIARKVAAVSGDVRRALSLCARSLEIAENLNESQVTMKVVDEALVEMSSSPKIQAIKQCSKLEQLILLAVASEVKRTGNEEVSFCSMMLTLNNLAILKSVTFPSYSLALQLCHKLGSFRLLITQHGGTDIELTLLLNISSDDIYFAL